MPIDRPIAPAIFEGEVYAAVAGTLSKWDGHSFLPVPPDQRAQTERGLRGGTFKDIAGWSSEYNLLSMKDGQRSYHLAFPGAEADLQVNAESRRRQAILRRQSQLPEILVDFDSGPLWVEEGVYLRTFARSQAR
jgi:hypothetical protein